MLSSDLKNVPWDSSYVYENIDDIWSHWSSLFKQVLVEHSSVKRVQLRNNQLPWIRPDIQKQIRIRNRFYKKFIRASTTLNWANYKKNGPKQLKISVSMQPQEYHFLANSGKS